MQYWVGIPVLMALADYLGTPKLKVKYQFPKCLHILAIINNEYLNYKDKV